MADQKFPKSNLPIRRSVEFLPSVFRTETNEKFLTGTLDPLIQPGALERLTGYAGRRYGKTYTGDTVYLDTDNTLRSRYQLEPGVIVQDEDGNPETFYDFLDFKNQLKLFQNTSDRDDLIDFQEHYSWNPPIDLDKFVNYREYYWMPLGPLTVQIAGQRQGVESTYKVKQGIDKAWVLTPDGLTNNPTITLYRGQTYRFEVNSPGEGFTIKTNYDTGSLNYDPNREYFFGDLAVYDGKLWRANTNISIDDGSTIDINSEDWDLLDESATRDSLNYNKGIENNGIEHGTLIFDVPLDAPDKLFYQSSAYPDRLGMIIVADVDSNTLIDVEKEIIGKSYYKSSNGVDFTNGLIVEFTGNAYPEVYENYTWLVEGVGEKITLTKFEDLVPPTVNADTPEILFDNEGFDTQPFDDATTYPTQKDYITIARNSADNNPWSRYNRWFHRSTIEKSYELSGRSFDAREEQRAKRPIIEFKPNLKLFNYGVNSKTTVDYVDDYTDDIFSKIEGSTSYNIDGEYLFEGARVLVVADTDGLANNKIYEVNFIVHNNKTQINLVETEDSNSVVGDCVLVRRGTNNAGVMYHFDGTDWVASQEKTSVNQAPLFDVFDENGVSFSDADTYPSSTFAGSKLLSYKIGSGPADNELGFSLSYLNINNVGDIEFNWNFETESFQWTENRQQFSKNLDTGYYKQQEEYKNGWIKTNNKFVQPIIDSVKVTETGQTSVALSTVNWDELLQLPEYYINFYLNGYKLTDVTYQIENNLVIFDRSFVENDVISVKIVGDITPDRGYYQVPLGIEKNPLNEELESFTLGQMSDHISTAIEFDDRVTGKFPGISNLRDISDYQQNATRFLKHSGIAPIALGLICDKENNIIKALEYSSNSYTTFKENFLKRALELEFNENVADFVDDIINDISSTKDINSPFADSDMIGAGAFSSLDFKVSDPGIKAYTLTENFDLTTLSRKAVYIYLNDAQLLAGRDYVFDDTFAYVTINVELAQGDTLQIREYVSTSFCHIPVTPTKLGLYKKYVPRKFLDDTYVEPREVIEGHDGSITSAFGDYRDDLLLELEYRIFNNIKVEYDPNLFNIDEMVSTYYYEGKYSKNEFDNIVGREFLKWYSTIGGSINYTENSYFDSENSFTYTYSNMTDPTQTESLPGWWRGVYRYFYDTDRPHTNPWEMLGFSIKPTWWEDEYGPAPYTNGNLILWEDLAEGIIRQGDRAGIYDRYKRPGMLNHIPVNADGELISPLESNLAKDFSLINNKGSFVLSDVAPVEHAWRISSEWPFAVIKSLTLMLPFEFITSNLNKSLTTRNIVGQVVNKVTGVFQKTSDAVIPDIGSDTIISGLANYLISYAKYKGVTDTEVIRNKIKNIDVRLSHRLSGFVDKAQHNYLLDSKNPSSSSSNIYIPPESYDIIFNESSPISSVSYSGVIIRKTNEGWTVSGYDNLQPYFTYYPPIDTQSDPIITVGGISETFVAWDENQTYNNGVIALYRNDYYRCNKTHTSGTTFDPANWIRLPNIPVTGAVEAHRRRNFRSYTGTIAYGTTFRRIQEVVDFLLGYGRFLEIQGFRFDTYDNENKVAQDWITSCKEFMFWTKHNWAEGSLISLSPAATTLEVTFSVGVAESLLDSFYDYSVLTSNGVPIDETNINVKRDFQSIKVTTTNTTDGIYFIRLFYVLKENVAIFRDRTVFNDVLFDKPSGYRQERIKVQGYRTVDWDGDYTSPGFIFDDVNIKPWQPYTNYRMGDIISYRTRNWTCQIKHTSINEFEEKKWSILDSNPEKGLVPNFDYRIAEFSDYFALETDGLSKTQKDLARHTIGYQDREYLSNLTSEPATQFNLYRGFIREKGTSNAVNKVFDKLSSRHGAGSVSLNEEWAFRTGSFGGVDQLKEVEFEIDKDNLEINPQPFLFVENKNETFYDRYYRLNGSDFTIKPIPYSTNINPTSYDAEPMLTAGYVKLGQTEYTLANRSDILSLDINQINDNDHFWITFDGVTWSTLRVNYAEDLKIGYAEKTKYDTYAEARLTINKPHPIVEGDYIGIKEIQNLTGFYQVLSTETIRENGLTSYFVTVEIPLTAENPVVEDSTLTGLYLFSEARFSTYEDLDLEKSALLKEGSKLWIDNNGSDEWEVVEKQSLYTPKRITRYGSTQPSETGYKVLYNTKNNNVISSMPGSGQVMSYIETADGLVMKQIIEPQEEFTTNVLGTFGKAMTLSPDNSWLAIGAPMASGLKSRFTGPFDPDGIYAQDDVVLYAGTLWKATGDVVGDGSTIDFESGDWEIATIVEGNPTASSGGEGYTQQGAIFLYHYDREYWRLHSTILSPRQQDYELFGSDVTIGITDTGYTMAVSAPGSKDNTGRVYTFNYTTADGWTFAENAKYRGRYNPGASFMGSLDVYTLTVESILDNTGYIQTGTVIGGPGIPDNTVVVSYDGGSGTYGGIGTYTVKYDSLPTSTATIAMTGTEFYPAGTIVWSEGGLWQAVVDSYSDGSTLTIAASADRTEWIPIDPIATSCSLPQSVALNDDGSTLASGMLSESQFAELVKRDEKFGQTLAMNRDASILIVGVPNADGVYFPNYKGIWRADTIYNLNDVVFYQYGYHKLIGQEDVINVPPDDSPLWENVGDSTVDRTGKIFVYRRDEFGIYQLDQTITADSIADYSDLEGEVISSGNKFGYAADIDATGNILVVSSPEADINYQNQGSVYVFEYSTEQSEFRLRQKIESYEKYPDEYFGQSVSISSTTGKVVVGASNARYSAPAILDSMTTTFDEGRTTFVTSAGFSGAVYVYQLKGSTYLLTEKLEDILALNESFGWSVDCTDSVVVVGSPKYNDGTEKGTARLFKKDPNVEPWNILSKQEPAVDISNLKSIALYDNVDNVKIQDLQVLDHAKLKILNSAEQELKFKTLYDPAVYSVGTEEHVVDEAIAWTESNVGQLWWDLSTAKWIHYEQGDTAYRSGNWNRLATGASIDVYEWVESTIPPSQWAEIADTTDGLAIGISGQPKYPDDSVYTLKTIFDPNTGEVRERYYYFWVKDTVILPNNVIGRRIPCVSVSAAIISPSTLETYLALAASDTIIAYNLENVLSNDTAVINMQYYKDDSARNNVHNEYVLLTEGVADSLPTEALERKWIDSLVGYDQEGNRVPDNNLPPKQRYGIKFRPRQGMFEDRIPVLQMIIEKINNILNTQPFGVTANLDSFNLVEEAPDIILNLYDIAVDTYSDLQAVGTTRVRPALLSANIVDGEIASVDVIDSGYGYRTIPEVEFEGTGTGAQAEAVLDNQGRITAVNMLASGRKYSSVVAKVRQFSVLVRTDETANGYWGIYAWDSDRKDFFRSRSQAYDTTKYWTFKDWWADGYSNTTRIVKELVSLYDEAALDINVNDIIRVKEYGSGGWAVFKKVAEQAVNPFDNYELIGRQNGTVELSRSIYDITQSGIGFDTVKSFDTGLYDTENASELRNIFKGLKEDIFVNEYAVYWNDLFFTSIRYAFVEQSYIDWAFKTSFLTATHTVGCFCRRPNYKSDGLEYYLDYINEVKPYRTTVRKFISRYDHIENNPTSVADFDLPPSYSEADKGITPITDSADYRLNSYPWKFWNDNQGYSVISIEIASGGSEYTQAPTVLIEGNGTGATATAYISSGRVTSVLVTNEGTGYTKAPTVTLVGGNAPGADVAKVVPILGKPIPRTMTVGMKFDRISKTGLYQNFNYEQTYVATGSTAVYDLTYAPDRNKNNILITINDQIILRNEYVITLYKEFEGTFTRLKGKVTFNVPPANGDVIKVTYAKNPDLFDAVNRIDNNYNPSVGMKGKELGQLMTGIDFGGVQVQGTTFEVTGGWDALPWFTDSWDSVESSSDYYVVVDGSTSDVLLPYVPAPGQEINVYLKRKDPIPPRDATIDNLQYTEEVLTTPIIRIDDPNFGTESQTNENALLPTFIGDGSTNVVELAIYDFRPGEDDILIFRPSESDGSVTITDENLLDTQVSGGTLGAMSGAYTTATGKTAEEIVIDGEDFVSPDQVQSPEEQIPGQVLDSVSIKVFQSSLNQTPTLHTNVLLGDDSTSVFEIGQSVLETTSAIVYVDKVKLQYDVDYDINFRTNEVRLNSIPSSGASIEIISLGLGSASIFDYQEYIGDGETTLFLTNASYEDTTSVFVTVDGIEVETGFTLSDDLTDTTNKTLVQFAVAPRNRQVVKIVVLGGPGVDEVTPVVQVNHQSSLYDGSTSQLLIENFIRESNGSPLSSVLIEVNDTILSGPDTVFGVYDGTNNSFTLGLDPEETAGSILPDNIKVFVNNSLIEFITDYVYDGTSKVLTINSNALTIGDSIKIENDLRSEFTIVDSNIVFSDTVSINENDKVDVTWFTGYDNLDIVSDEITGGQVRYRLPRVPVSASYVWVYKNGVRLTQDLEYTVSIPRNSVYLTVDTTTDDKIKIVLFGSDIFKLPSAYEIHKDMLNVYHFKRYSTSDVVLAKDLYYYDLTLEVTDGSILDEPIRSRNIPGVIIVNNERIEYLQKDGNVLSQLRRGTLGTAIKDFSEAGTRVINSGQGENIPYTEDQERYDFYSDGSSQDIGPLGFIPTKSATPTTWTRDTIPSDYGQCDTVEVFVGGTRLRKAPLEVFDETLGAASPAGNKILEAEFSVDGISDHIRLTESVPAGTRISVIVKKGRTWYDRGIDTATTGVTLLDNESPIAKFIADKTTKLPE